MPHFITHTINSTFETMDEGVDYPSLAIAYKSAVTAGLAIASDEIHAGKNLGTVEIRLEDGDGHVVARGVVTAAASPLCVG